MDEIQTRKQLIEDVDYHFNKLKEDELLNSLPTNDWFKLQQRANKLPLATLKTFAADLQKYTSNSTGTRARDPEKDVLIALINMHDARGSANVNYFTLHKKSISELQTMLNDLRKTSAQVISPDQANKLL